MSKDVLGQVGQKSNAVRQRRQLVILEPEPIKYRLEQMRNSNDKSYPVRMVSRPMQSGSDVNVFPESESLSESD